MRSGGGGGWREGGKAVRERERRALGRVREDGGGRRVSARER